MYIIMNVNYKIIQHNLFHTSSVEIENEEEVKKLRKSKTKKNM